MPRIRVDDGEPIWIDEDRISARLVELTRYDRPTTRQRSELAALSKYQSRQGQLEAAYRSGQAEHPELHASGAIAGRAAWPYQEGQFTDRARHVIDDLHSRSEIPDRSAMILTAMVTEPGLGADTRARHAEWVAATGDPLYLRTFTQLLMQGAERAGVELDRAERESIARVRRASRALAMGTNGGADGGYAVPLSLDPTVILTSSGQVNPLRQIARVETIVGKSFLAVTSSGVTVSRASEAEEASDDSPSLGQPEVTPGRVQGFVPFSIEVGQDWTALQSELTRMLADAKAAEEADYFVGGTAAGLIGTMGTASVVSTAGTATLVLADVESLVGQLPPRWQARAQFAASLPAQLALARLERVATVSAVSGSGGGKQLLDIGLHEISTMDTGGLVADATTPSQKITATSTQQPLLYGDFSQYLIVERLGMTVELIPHLFGTANNRPTGQRGLYAIWRNNAQILVPDAFRLLKVK